MQRTSIGSLRTCSIELRVTVRLDADGVNACVSVIDDGPGLTAEEAATVFDRHKRLGDPSLHGHGLGLHICRRIVDAHCGFIGVSSTPGKGSRFYFELVAVPGPTRG